MSHKNNRREDHLLLYLFNNIAFNIITFLSFLTISQSVFSHGDHHEELDEHQLEEQLEFYKNLFELDPVVLQNISAKNYKSTPGIEIQGESVYLSPVYWDFFLRWMEIYVKEVKRDCSECSHFHAETILKKAERYLPPSFWEKRVLKPLKERVHHIALEGASLGARHGKGTLIAFIVAEIFESMLLVFMGGGPDWHFACAAIDATVVFGTRHVQAAWRIPQFASELNQSSSAALFRTWYFSSILRRAQKRVHFLTGPIAVDDSMLQKLDSEGHKRWGRFKKNRRSEWLKTLAKHSERIEKKRQEIENYRLSGQWTEEKAKKKLNALSQKQKEVSELNKKIYLGKRYKRLLWIYSRKGKNQHLKGHGISDHATDSNLVWIMGAQVMLHRGLVSNAHSESWHKKILPQEMTDDPVRNYLAKNFLGEEANPDHVIFVERILEDVAMVFDSNLSKGQRFLHTVAIEGLLGKYILTIMEPLMQASSEDTKFMKKLRNEFNWRWEVDRYGAFVYQFADWLRTIAYSSDPVILQQNKHDAMESFLRIFKHLQKLIEVRKKLGDQIEPLEKLIKAFDSLRGNTNKLQQESQHEKLVSGTEEIKELNRLLFDNRNWLPRKKISKWRYPKCIDLHQKH